MCNKDLKSPVGKLSQRRFITVYDDTGEVEIKLWGKRLMHTQPPKGTVFRATCLTVDSYLNRTSLNRIMSTVVEVRTLISDLPNPIQVFLLNFQMIYSACILHTIHYTHFFLNVDLRKGRRSIWDYCGCLF